MNLSILEANEILTARPASDGDGVRIKRIAGRHLAKVLDPFLLVDEIDLNEDDGALGGFPAHPHRGFQTLTYMLKGGFRHQDSMGNTGCVDAGGIQWMSAASGVIHSEMPVPDKGQLHGFQLWVNLPSGEKMRAPEYRDIQGSEITTWPIGHRAQLTPLVGRLTVNQEVYSGKLMLEESHAVVARLVMEKEQSVALTIPAQNNFNVLVYNGQIEGVEQGQLAHFSSSRHERILTLSTSSVSAALLVLAGEPINEPIVQYGPFVMNTMEEVEQALRDYRCNNLVQSF